jgi:hypothetical protein
MQTVIQLDDALLDQANKLAKEKGCDLSHLIEETLRDKIAPKPPVAGQPFLHLTTVGGEGVRPGVDLNNSAALLTLMESEDDGLPVIRGNGGSITSQLIHEIESRTP